MRELKLGTWKATNIFAGLFKFDREVFYAFPTKHCYPIAEKLTASRDSKISKQAVCSGDKFNSALVENVTHDLSPVE